MGQQRRSGAYAAVRASAKKRIAAAVDLADGVEGAEAPPELQMAWFCGPYHLPRDGGMGSQDYDLITKMRILENVYNAVTKMRSLKGDEINTRLSNGERVVLEEVQKMGLLRGLNRG